ncbi:MAG: T9SS type A sorting domain-containing protein [Bacteroidales bacterium]
MIYKVDPNTGNSLQSVNSPGDACVGLTWDGEHLWTDDFETDKLYCLNPNNGEIIYEVNSPHTNPRDLAWDGDYLWVMASASNTIFQVDVGYNTSIVELGSSFGNVSSVSISPNPVFEHALISYSINQKAQIQIHMYNSDGILISTLLQKVHIQASHQLEIDASELNAGMYYIVIQSGQDRVVEKMIKIE